MVIVSINGNCYQRSNYSYDLLEYGKKGHLNYSWMNIQNVDTSRVTPSMVMLDLSAKA